MMRSLRLIFSDEATIHTNGRVNRHSVRIRGKQNLHTTPLKHSRDSLKVNVFCAMSYEKVIFFF